MSYKNSYEIFDEYAILHLRDNMHTKISLSDLNRVRSYKYKWHARYNETNKSYYVSASCKGKTVQLHRFIMGVHTIFGEHKKFQVDHFNYDTLDNRRENLRITTKANNSKHRKGINSNNTSGHRNVCWNKAKKKWMVQLQVNGKNTKLGYFDDVDEAGAFATLMREKHYGVHQGE